MNLFLITAGLCLSLPKHPGLALTASFVCVCVQCSHNLSQTGVSLQFSSTFMALKESHTEHGRKGRNPTTTHWSCGVFVLWEVNQLRRYMQCHGRVDSQWFALVTEMAVIAKEDFSDQISIDIGDIQFRYHGL